MPASRPAKALRGQRNAWRPANTGTRVPRGPFPRGKRATNAPRRHTKENNFYYGACHAFPTGVCSVHSAHGSKTVPKKPECYVDGWTWKLWQKARANANVAVDAASQPLTAYAPVDCHSGERPAAEQAKIKAGNDATLL
ncbi:unnamed protein product [Ixodes pacificus]